MTAPRAEYDREFEQKTAIAVINARACAGGGDQSMQERPDERGIDGELGRVLIAWRRPHAFARRKLQELVRIDGDGIGLPVAEAEIAAAMMSAWMVRLCTRAWIRSARN